MGLLERLYDKSPIGFQNMMVSLSGFQRNMSRYGKAYYEYLDFLSDFDKWSLKKKIDYQNEELVRFIRYAVDNSKFYRELYKDIDINSIKTIADLKKLPIVDKELLRKNIDDVCTIPHKGAVEGHTGGTTGKSLVVLFTPEDMMRRMAMLDHFKDRVGFVHRKMKRATFNGKHIIPPNQKKKVFWRYNKACKQMIYSSFHLTEENMQYYVESLNKFKPQALDGFFMSICDIAGYIERHSIKLEFTPTAIFPTSETLTESGRQLLERVFKCKVYDQYASSEGAPFVTECKSQVLHMELASGVFEHFECDSDEVLVTSYTTHGTPLIRYRIGDSIVLDDKNDKCECGIESHTVKEIEGRKLDFLYTAEGAKINGGNVANLFKNMPNALIRAQTIQEKIDEITIKLEVDENLYKSEYDDLLRDEFVHKFGTNTKIIIEHVDEIPREKSGKFRLIKNSVKK
ncbi:phenylacetate--CoA ligase family protein [Rossellomorea yichunensis]|jgi:phenylacetate-CoA ligase|uniref:phenylacetate--CoA ligase family protein n=1 Tax=Rossellomorea yichunensis TaxID=3077331 RepID=UPI0028E00157|nr:phenylacetate--CoA ligase family protein [Rossellomorea sp. YC4-1]MDT9026817.1 phenylacetate--CoA ligase family protein [Rossellomorea sp. YC4-1]